MRRRQNTNSSLMQEAELQAAAARSSNKNNNRRAFCMGQKRNKDLKMRAFNGDSSKAATFLSNQEA